MLFRSAKDIGPWGLCPQTPEVYRLFLRGSATGIGSARLCATKRAIPYGIAPSEASRRSGRSSALPYMTPNQQIWVQARDRLVAAVTGIGFSAELAELMARQLGSPKAIDRMTSYVYQARPRTEEMLVDEMLAI